MGNQTSTGTRVTARDWRLGRPEAPITVLEYSDFECPHCAVTRPVLADLVAENPTVVKLVSGISP